MSKDKDSSASADAEKKGQAPVEAVKPEPTHWAVKLDGNPELIVPTPEQAARGLKARSEAEAWTLYALHFGISSTTHQYSAGPVESPAAA